MLKRIKQWWAEKRNAVQVWYQMDDAVLELYDRKGRFLGRFRFEAEVSQPMKISTWYLRWREGTELAKNFLLNANEAGFVELPDGRMYPFCDIGTSKITKRFYKIGITQAGELTEKVFHSEFDDVIWS